MRRAASGYVPVNYYERARPYAPAPTYYAPAAVYCEPAPVYCPPPRVSYAPVRYSIGIGYSSWGGRHHYRQGVGFHGHGYRGGGWCY